MIGIHIDARFHAIDDSRNELCGITDNDALTAEMRAATDHNLIFGLDKSIKEHLFLSASQNIRVFAIGRHITENTQAVDRIKNNAAVVSQRIKRATNK